MLLALLPILAIVISDQIGVAGIGTIGLIIVAIIQNWHQTTKQHKVATDAKAAADLAAVTAADAANKIESMVDTSVGVKNSQGNVIEMLEVLKERTNHLDERLRSLGESNGNGSIVEMLERIDKRTISVQKKLDHVDGLVDQQDKRIMDLRIALETQIKRYDAEHPHPPARGPGRVFPLNPLNILRSPRD